MGRWRTWWRISWRPIWSCARARTRFFSKPLSEAGRSHSRNASMRLVKSGHVIDDRYVRVLDDAPIPDDAPVIIPAARFLAHAAGIARREAPTGFTRPNNRKVAELAHHLDRLALVALVFPPFRDDRA